MQIDVEAFADELSKIAEAQDGYAWEKMLRALKAGLASSGAFGLGWGLGSVAAERGLLPYISKKFPHPTPGQLRTGMLLLGGVGALGSMANSLWKHRLMNYINQPDQGAQ